MGLVQYTKTDAVAFGIAGEPGVVYYDCKELWTAEELQSFTLAIFIITYGLPMAVIAFTYFSIGLRMFNRAAPGNADAGRDRLQKESNNKVRGGRRTMTVKSFTVILHKKANGKIISLPSISLLKLFFLFPSFFQMSDTENAHRHCDRLCLLLDADADSQ